MTKVLLGLLVLAGLALGQVGLLHSISLAWTDPNNPAGTTYNVYRQNSGCPTTQPVSTSGFTKLNASPVSTLTFSDSPVVVGTTYCYIVTAVSAGAESGPSPDAGATPIPFSPATLQLTAH
jgi:hypothetical protein